jgi:hypothetical protein
MGEAILKNVSFFLAEKMTSFPKSKRYEWLRELEK